MSLAKSYRDQSYLNQIKGLEFASSSTLAVAESNVIKQQQELNFQLAKASKDFRSLSSSQRASAGASGFLVNSDSFLNVYNEAASVYGRDVSRLKDVTKQNQQTLYKEALRQAETYRLEILGIKLQQSADNVNDEFTLQLE